MAKLDAYRKKRREGATNEPFGDDALASSSGTLAGAFVVHLHDATRRHFDLRLEVDGVLASFAVPRGISLDPDAKHLAVRTEDHPLEYLDFEDVIPDGQYGAGAMIAWDRGWAEWLEGPAHEEIANDKIHVRLHGHKLRGAFALVKLKKSAKGDEWLLFKKADEHADAKRDLTTELPCSILSGLTVEELGRRAAIGTSFEKRATKLGGKKRGDAPFALGAAKPGTARPRSRYDAELDGLRVLATRDGDVVTLHAERARGKADAVEAFYPDVVRALRALPPSRIALDAMLVAFDASGRPSWARLAERAARVGRGEEGAHAVNAMPVVLVVSDVLAVGDVDVRSCPLEGRRELLEALLPSVGIVRAAPALAGELDAVRASCAALGVGALVAKPPGSAYGTGWTRHPTGVSLRPRVAIDHGASDARAALRKVEVSNRKKPFWPDEGITKGDLCDYYSAIGETILPYLHARPIILVRYPDGITGKSFFQWNVPPGMPPWVRTLELATDEGTRRGFFVDDPTTLLYVTNLGNIPIHILACRAPDVTFADFFTIDFDVKQSELRHAVTLARTLRELLDAVGLPGFPKTSGQSGLHVLCPLGPGHGFDTARALAELLGRLLVERHPDIATMERAVGKRGARVYVDTGQTGASRAIVAPYSVRAVPGATVSTPLVWDEVERGLDPRAFTLRTVPERIARIGDPMRDLLRVRPDVAAAVTKLAALVGRA